MDIKFIEPEVPYSGRGTIIDLHTAKQKSKNCPGVHRISCFRGVEVIGGGGRKCEEKTDDVMDRGKESEVEYRKFSMPHLFQGTDAVTILASADKLRRFRGAFDSTQSYTFCRNM